jgi:hypothetical protein
MAQAEEWWVFGNGRMVAVSRTRWKPRRLSCIRWTGWLPDGLYLQDAFTRVRRAAKIVWRGLTEFGVQFTRAKPEEPTGFGRRRRS